MFFVPFLACTLRGALADDPADVVVPPAALVVARAAAGQARLRSRLAATIKTLPKVGPDALERALVVLAPWQSDASGHRRVLGGADNLDGRAVRGRGAGDCDMVGSQAG